MPKYRSYTVTFKLEAIAWHRAHGGNVSRTAKEYNVDRKRIREWLENEDLLESNRRGKDAKKRRIGAGSSPISIDLEIEILDWFLEERAQGRIVLNKDISEKGMAVAQNLGLQGFLASSSWVRRWKKRNSISLRLGTNESQHTPADLADKVRDFRNAIIQKRTENQYINAHIGNMDETMCRFDMPGGQTNHVRGDRTVRIASTGASKRGFTVCLTAFADGTKMPAFVVFKEANGIIPPRIYGQLVIPHNVRVSASINGWMTYE
jgi:hypothetical protein